MGFQVNKLFSIFRRSPTGEKKSKICVDPPHKYRISANFMPWNPKLSQNVWFYSTIKLTKFQKNHRFFIYFFEEGLAHIAKFIRSQM